MTLGFGFGVRRSRHRPAGGVVPPGPGPGTYSVDPIVQRQGQVYTFTARRTNTAAAETRTFALAGSTAYPPAATAGDFGGAFPSGPVNFAAGAATAPFSVTVPATVQPE